MKLQVRNKETKEIVKDCVIIVEDGEVCVMMHGEIYDDAIIEVVKD